MSFRFSVTFDVGLDFFLPLGVEAATLDDAVVALVALVFETRTVMSI
jgi:hypothetical protein